ncbi:DUF4129 domain-containing transglutaminase family protein [Desulfosediminicola ganghwensis]|uniref:DUF4129 domain-containing transglutaminase family protein n=1 Tax=Desulfosediminicola ganghwensis TaxID=2569540 RepID=UPI0010AD17E3|nr:transglutaminase domain-containing protein [Desulfosediminicola ganghwensis]
MKVPSPLIAATALFWAVESNNLLIGFLLAALIAGSSVMPRRLHFSDNDFIRISDLTSVIFLLTAALILLNVDKVLFLKTLVIWQPLILAPVLLAQLYTGRQQIVIGTGLGGGKKKGYKHEPLDFRHFYLGGCLFAAAMANSRGIYFYPFAGALSFWLLLVNRSRAFSVVSFSAIFVCALSLGYLGMKGAEDLHHYLRQKARMYMQDYFAAKFTDPYQSHLSYGNIGRLKGSSKIVMWVDSPDIKLKLLKQATYETYGKQAWHSSNQFEHLMPRGIFWHLMAAPYDSGKLATIEFYLPKEKGLLPYPYGSYKMRAPDIYEAEQKRDGTTRILDAPPLVTYEIFYDQKISRKSDEMLQKHLLVSGEQKELLESIASEFALEGASVSDRLEQVRTFLATGFTYSLDVERQSWQTFAKDPLETFLLKTKSGHCELYATAATLLLRQLGVPSRYVTGFAISEKERFGERYVVRERHAHAWSEALVGNRWVVVDTTPADWLGLELENRSSFEWLGDLWALLKLKYDQFRIHSEFDYRYTLSAIIVFLSLILIYRIYRRINVRKVSQGAVIVRKEFPSQPTPLAKIEQTLAKSGLPRKSGEPFLSWAHRIDAIGNDELSGLREIFRLHLKMRFDPGGVNAAELAQFEDLVERWLVHYQQKAGSELT